MSKYIDGINEDNVEAAEALAAKEYFACYPEYFNRREENNINNGLNYGYGYNKG